MPLSTQKPSGQDETGSRSLESVLDGTIDKIADVLASHRALQPLWKAVELGADVVEALHYHITTPLRTDVTRSTARVLCFESILPMISLSRILLGSFESALLYYQCAAIYLLSGAFAGFLYAEVSTKKMRAADLFEATVLLLSLSAIFALHSTVSLSDAFLAPGAFFLPGWLFSVAKILAGLLWNTDSARAERNSGTSEVCVSDSRDGTTSCPIVEDSPRPEAELRGAGVGKESGTRTNGTPESNVTTVLQENLLIAQNNMKLLELARNKDWSFYTANMTRYRAKMAEMAEMVEAHRTETADLKDRLVKMNTACAQMHTTSQQELSELTTKLSEAERQLEAKCKALDNMRNFWEADVISKRNALKEKSIRLEQVTDELHLTEKRFKEFAESSKSKEAKFATRESDHETLLRNLEITFRNLRAELSTSQKTLHTTETKLIESRKEYFILAAQHETSSKEIQNLTQKLEAFTKKSENSEKRIKSLKNWCKFWQENAGREYDARMSLQEQVGLAKDGIEKIEEEEVENARRECENAGESEGEVEEAREMENEMEVEKIENVDEEWENVNDDEFSVAEEEE
ncbi:hypothetical protein HII31_00740 [Pseudocercospora fuligena]|uniref:Uncharacterized protein n=1 Tax=Pseudocercospora fuligena TaxID=685502 RepID=A0A8H6RVR3_9PEZI|nr:hypothetical protein HII31_00740 [Pseudocercospora fuligena]